MKINNHGVLSWQGFVSWFCGEYGCSVKEAVLFGDVYRETWPKTKENISQVFLDLEKQGEEIEKEREKKNETRY